MEEQILGILEKITDNEWGYFDDAAKEISVSFREFNKWKEMNVLTDRISKKEIRYMLRDINSFDKWMNFDELYQHWLTKIKK